MTNFAGFDRLDPIAKAQRDWVRENSNARWLGGYLPSPSQYSRAWCGLWTTLRQEGWGLAPVYVGQQVLGLGSHNVTAVQGVVDGYEACDEMREEGFADGSFVFLDHESPSPEFVSSGYTAAWVDTVVAGGFGAGIYCSFLQGAQFAALRPGVRVWVYRVPTVNRTAYPTDDFPDLDPATSGFAGAKLWQLRDNITIPVDGRQIVVDLDSAAMRDPSAPRET